MKISLKLTGDLLRRVEDDLSRHHPFAAERVGFMTAHAAHLTGGGILLLAFDYVALPDDVYVQDDSIGARVHADGFRIARQRAYTDSTAIIHVHEHDHRGTPAFSSTDTIETRRFMPDFLHVRPTMPHAAVILSRDSMVGRCWVKGKQQPVPIQQFTIVGPGVRKISYV